MSVIGKLLNVCSWVTNYRSFCENISSLSLLRVTFFEENQFRYVVFHIPDNDYLTLLCWNKLRIPYSFIMCFIIFLHCSDSHNTLALKCFHPLSHCICLILHLTVEKHLNTCNAPGVLISQSFPYRFHFFAVFSQKSALWIVYNLYQQRPTLNNLRYFPFEVSDLKNVSQKYSFYRSVGEVINDSKDWCKGFTTM